MKTPAASSVHPVASWLSLGSLLVFGLGCSGLFGGELTYEQAEEAILTEHFTDTPHKSRLMDKTAWCRLRTESTSEIGEPETYTLTRFGVGGEMEYEIVEALTPGCVGKMRQLGAVTGEDTNFAITDSAKVVHPEEERKRYIFYDILVPCGAFELDNIDLQNKLCETFDGNTICHVSYTYTLAANLTTLKDLTDLCGPALEAPSNHLDSIQLQFADMADGNDYWYAPPGMPSCSWSMGVCD